MLSDLMCRLHEQGCRPSIYCRQGIGGPGVWRAHVNAGDNSDE